MEEKNNQPIQEQVQVDNKTVIINTLITLIIFGGIIGGILYGIFHWIDTSTQKDREQRDILSALNQKGYQYTNKSTFTEEDFTAKKVVKSDYKPIYEVRLTNGDILYIGFVYPKGKEGLPEIFCINGNLDRVKNSINESI